MPACSVVYCGSRTEKGIRLFSLPQGDRNEERRNTWIQNINRKELPSNIFVCEKHFKEDQFENNRKDGRRPLKYNAIPTVFENKPLKRADKPFKFVDKSYKLADKPETLPLSRSRRSLRILKPKVYSGYVSETEDDPEEEKNKVCGKKVRCRACLAVIEIASANELSKQLLGKSIKTRMLLFIPQLSPSLLDTEYICDKCCRLLLNFVRFYDSCLDTDMKLKNGKISLTVDEKGKEDSQECKYTNSTDAQSTPQKVGRKRKQDLVSVRKDNAEEVQDNNEENSQEEVIFKKRGRPRKVIVPQDGIAVVEDVTRTADSLKNASSQNVIDKETTLEVRERRSLSSKDNEKDIAIEEKENADNRKSNQKEPEGKKSDNCDNKTNPITDHDYINDVFHCPECQTDYRTPKGMRNHLITHHHILEENEMQCTRCNMKFIRYKDMLKHKHAHGSPCDLCDEIFSSTDELKSHKNSHPESYSCMKCARIFEQEDMLKGHSLLHDAMTKVISAIQKLAFANSCDSCDMIFSAKHRLLEHVKTVHLKIRDIKCTECEKLFSTKSLMSMHVRLKHTNNKSHKCDVCEAAFKRPDHLAFHKLTHNFTDPNRRTYGRQKEDTEKVFQCPFCFTISGTKQLLIAHLSIHANERKFECRYCGLKLSSLRTQLIHEKTHEADPNSQFVCMTCWKKFPTEEDLKTHELIHLPNIKRFSCCLCGTKFARKMMLENHLLDMHIKGPDVTNENIDKTIEIIDIPLENNDGQVIDGIEEGEIIIQDLENVEEIVETDEYEENKIDEHSTMEERINKATFIILNDKDIYGE